MPCTLCKVNPPTDAEKGPDSGSAHQSNTGDKSWPPFSIYSKVVSKEDELMAERWKGDADGILIFTGLFSAAVAAFLAVSFQGLRPDPQDTSTFYLRNIYLVSAGLNTSIPSAATQPPSFSPSTNAILVNLLWILSLGIALTTAVMATILQQWARQYLKLTQAVQLDLDPKTKARVHALFSGSTDKLLINCLDYLLPCYLHLSVLLFFVGLLLFLFDINNRIFNATLWLFVFSISIYSFFTFLPFFLRDSMLFTPVSALPVALSAFFISIFTTALGFRFNAKLSKAFERRFKYVERYVDRTAKRLDSDSDRLSDPDRLSELDIHILEATLDFLGEDDTVEKSFKAIPDLLSDSSKHRSIAPQSVDDFKRVMNDFLDRTSRSTTAAESVKSSRLLICLDASRAAGPKVTSEILSNIVKGTWPGLLQSVEVGHSLRSWSNGRGRDEEHIKQARSIASRIIANTERHDDHSGTHAIPIPLLRDVSVPATLPASPPLPTPPSDVTAIDARTDVSSILSTANPNSHSISGGVVTSRQNNNRSPVVPPSVNDVVSRSDHPPHALGSMSPPTMIGRPNDIQDADSLQPGDRQHHLDHS